MTDGGYRLTDKELAALEQKIAGVYKDAADDLEKTINEYFASFEKRDAEMQKQLENGDITDEYYKQWKLNQIGRGKRFEAMRDIVAERYTNANEVAIAYVNDSTPTIYSLNRNYAAYTVNQTHGIDFTLFDERTVRRLIVDSPELMPYYPKEKALKRGIDLEYGKKYIAKHVTGGILQGKGIGEIASDLQRDLEKMERSSAIRTARTACTSAQNGGRQDLYDAVEKEYGIKIQKQWNAHLDYRTRHEHGEADGQIVDNDKPFNVGGELLMFPGDPSGSPGNTYNCRCRQHRPDYAEIPGEPHMMRVKVEVIDPETGKKHYEYELRKKISYKEWKAEQEAKGVNVDAKRKAAYNEKRDAEQLGRYQTYLKEKAPKSLDELQTAKYNNLEAYSIWKADYKQAKAMEELTMKVDSGELPLKVSFQNQNRHIQGTMEFNRYAEQRKNKGKTPQSVFYGTPNDAQELGKKYSRTGYVEISGKPKSGRKYVEYVEADKIVGQYFKDDEFLETKRFAIFYGKKGFHIVPVRELDE